MGEQKDLWAKPDEKPKAVIPAGSRPERVVLEVQILTAPFRRMSKKGADYLEFSAKMTERPWNTMGVLVFGEDVAKLSKNVVGDKITISGRYDEKDEGRFLVRGVSKQGDRARSFSLRSYKAQLYGSHEKYKEALAAHHQEQSARGMVRIVREPASESLKREKAVVIDYVPDSYAINSGGRWMLKVDYLADRLGPQELTNRMMAHFFPGRGNATPETLFSGLLDRKPISKKDYLEFVNKLIAEVSPGEGSTLWVE